MTAPITEAARALVDKLAQVHAHPSWLAMFSHSEARFGPYDGPQYGPELDDLAAALDAPPANEGEVERLRAALSEAARTFREYERLHQAKVDQGRSDHGHAPAGAVAKVERNRALAERMEAALSTPAQSGKRMAIHPLYNPGPGCGLTTAADIRASALSPDASKVGAVDVVTQADRDAAANAYCRFTGSPRHASLPTNLRCGNDDDNPLVQLVVEQRLAALRASPPPVEAGMADAERRGERRAIARIAAVAREIGWQAGVGGRETAGAIVSYLITSPDEVAPFVAGDLSPLDFAGDWMRGGALTWHGVDGKVWSPEEAAAAREAKSAAPKDMEEGAVSVDDVNSIADAELIRQVIAGQRKLPRRKSLYLRPLWSKVADRFCLGSTYAAQLCRRFGFDPNEQVRP